MKSESIVNNTENFRSFSTKSLKDPVFIVGMARTGTTLVARMLSKHSHMHILNETHFVRELGTLLDNEIFMKKMDEGKLHELINQFLTIQNKGYYSKGLCEDYKEETQKIVERYLSRAKESKKKVSVFLKTIFEHEWKKYGKEWGGDQTPNHVFHIDLIFNLFPNAKIIHTYRDPRAVILSQKNKWRASKRRGQPKFEIMRTLFSYHPITQSVLWKKSINSSMKSRDKFGSENFYDVCFEEITNDPETVLRALCQFLRIDFEIDMLQIPLSMSSNILHPINTIGINKDVKDVWRTRLSKGEIFIAEYICGKEAEKLGYKKIVVRFKFLSLLFWLALFPVHLIVASMLNMERIKKLSNLIKIKI